MNTVLFVNAAIVFSENLFLVYKNIYAIHVITEVFVINEVSV